MGPWFKKCKQAQIWGSAVLRYINKNTPTKPQFVKEKVQFWIHVITAEGNPPHQIQHGTSLSPTMDLQELQPFASADLQTLWGKNVVVCQNIFKIIKVDPTIGTKLGDAILCQLCYTQC